MDSSQLYLYSTTVSDVGTVRSNNQDSSFAGERIAIICDGMGGHAGGDIASTIAIRSLVHIEKSNAETSVCDIVAMLNTSFNAAHDAIVGKARVEHQLAGMGTTVTSVCLIDGYWVLAHIGDSRAYLLRDSSVLQMTRDHNYVQHLIDTGRITESEAKNHPQRNIVMRVLGDFDMKSNPDIAVIKARPADRWLLCSDGLCGVLEESTIESVLNDCINGVECAQKLVAMALKAGSTDNVTAVIADSSLALNAQEFDLPHQMPSVGGAASASLESIADILNQQVISAPSLTGHEDSPALRAAALARTSAAQDDTCVAAPVQERVLNEESVDTGEIPVVEDQAAQEDALNSSMHTTLTHDGAGKIKKKRKKSRRGIVAAIIAFMLVVLLIVGSAVAYAWSQTKYFVGLDDYQVTIYQGIHTNLFGFKIYHSVQETNLLIGDLPRVWMTQLDAGIPVDSFKEAQHHVDLIKREIEHLQPSSDRDPLKSLETGNNSNQPGNTQPGNDQSGGNRPTDSQTDNAQKTGDHKGSQSGDRP